MIKESGLSNEDSAALILNYVYLSNVQLRVPSFETWAGYRLFARRVPFDCRFKVLPLSYISYIIRVFFKYKLITNNRLRTFQSIFGVTERK